MSSIYHEIKTPLNGIVVSTELIATELKKLMNGQAGANSFVDLEEWVNIIRLTSSSLCEIIENMLTFSKIQSSNLLLELKPILLKDLFVPVKHMISSYPRSKDVAMKFDIQETIESYYVLANQTALQQVILNLVTNAFKFTHEGEVKVRVKADKAGKLVIEVSDTGIGMSEEFMRTRLFQPFQQEENVLTSKQRGVGLGLALCKHMVERMNGTISVMSSKYHGTIFTITLPLITKPVITPVSPPPKLSPNSMRDIGKLKEVRALVVDDNPLNLRVMTNLLSKIGFITTGATSGEAAIEIVENCKDQNMDVILMDIFMPGMGGIEAAKIIKEKTRHWRTPVLILGSSADTSSQNLLNCMENGITQFIHKPIQKKDIEDLFAQLQQKKVSS